MEFTIRNGRLVASESADGSRVEFPEGWDHFILRLRDANGGEVTLCEHDANLTDAGEASGGYYASIKFNLSGGWLVARMSVSPSDPEARMKLDIENRSDLEVISADFPRLPVSGITPDHALYLSTPWGSRNYDFIKLIRENHSGEAFRRYPADLAMQYNMISDGENVDYLSAYQFGDEAFEVRVTVLSDDSVAMTNRWFPYLAKGTWDTPENGIARLRGTWHTGADLYRSRMKDYFRPPNDNEWLRQNFHGWVQVCMKSTDQAPFYRFVDLPAVYDRIAETGLRVIHVYGWAGHGHDTTYPDYEFNPELGTEEEFRAAMDEIKARGGRAEIYTNGRLIDPNSKFFKTVGSKSSIVAEDGSRPTENYGTGVDFELACPSSETYRNYFASQVENLITRFRPHAIQIDQVSCNASELCFSTEHGHSKPSNNWLTGIDKFLVELRTMYLSRDPEFWVWVEGMNERFGQYYDINQGHSVGEPWNIGVPYEEQFHYTYPDYLVVGYSEGLDQMLHTFARGKPFDFHLADLDDPRFKRIITDLVSVRKEESEYFMRGRFMDTVGFTAEGEGIESRAIRGAKGVMINLWSPGSTDDDAHIAVINGDAIQGTPRLVYPKGAKVAGSGCYEVSWNGPVASIAWE